MNFKQLSAKVILGALSLLTGVLIILATAGVYEKWWCIFGLAVVSLGLLGISKNNSLSANIFSLLITVLGISITLFILIEFNFNLVIYIIGAIAVFLGFSFIISAFTQRREGETSSVIMGSKRYDSVEIRSENINVVMASLTLDYRSSELKEDSTINITSAFASINIILPNDIRVKYKSSSYLSSFSDRKPKNAIEGDAKTLTIVSDALFSGVSIRYAN